MGLGRGGVGEHPHGDRQLVVQREVALGAAPAQLEQWRNRQVAAIGDPTNAPDPDDLAISDDDIRETIENNQLRLMDERGSDVTVFSPRASFMAHHIGDFEVSSTWSRICNDLCHRVSTLYPTRFAMGAMLPQSPGVDPATVVPELRRSVEELGAVVVNMTLAINHRPGRYLGVT